MKTLNAGEDSKKVSHLYIGSENVMTCLENGLTTSFLKIK